MPTRTYVYMVRMYVYAHTKLMGSFVYSASSAKQLLYKAFGKNPFDYSHIHTHT
jgi:hypothetical protein